MNKEDFDCDLLLSKKPWPQSAQGGCAAPKTKKVFLNHRWTQAGGDGQSQNQFLNHGLHGLALPIRVLCGEKINFHNTLDILIMIYYYTIYESELHFNQGWRQVAQVGGRSLRSKSNLLLFHVKQTWKSAPFKAANAHFCHKWYCP
jgi:hypothetical protein